eukprot:2322958-Prymnesium_polylepis.1
MPNATSGVLLTCDAAMKQFVVHIDEERKSKHGEPSFVIEDLDETHLFVRAEHVAFIEQKIMELQDSNAFSRDEAPPEKVAAEKKERARKKGGDA